MVSTQSASKTKVEPGSHRKPIMATKEEKGNDSFLIFRDCMRGVKKRKRPGKGGVMGGQAAT